jgi:acetylornithine aminotransferase
MDSRRFEAEHFFQTYKRLPLEIDRGEGAYVFTASGERYLDMFAGIAVNALGHRHAGILRAIAEQAEKYVHASNYFLQQPQLRLAQLLLKHSGYKRIFFTNSGAEATEGAMKVARRFGIRSGKSEMLGFSNGFHGRTLGALSVMDRREYREGFEPFLDQCHVLPFNDPPALRTSITDQTVAVVVEYIQGEGGIRPVSREFAEALEELRRQHGFLIIADEVQSGLGRTGRLFAYQHYNAKPDLVLVAKSLGGGLPLGAILGNATVGDVLQPGSHGSTFGGNPVACAAGIVLLTELIDNGVMKNAETVGDILVEELLELKNTFPAAIKEVRGYGLMIGVELHQESEPIASRLREKRVLVNSTDKTVLRIIPPLIIGKSHVEEFIKAFEEVLSEVK